MKSANISNHNLLDDPSPFVHSSILAEHFFHLRYFWVTLYNIFHLHILDFILIGPPCTIKATLPSLLVNI